jgi:DNA-binding transcriptional ArsR family regulator
MLNPIRMRIIQELSHGQSITATELGERISDVPRTTLYRHIKILIDNNILFVVSEKKVRGSLERTIVLNISEITKSNTIENATQKAFGFLMSNYAKFHNYFGGENHDPARDRIFMNSTVLMMSDTEFDQFLGEMRELLLKYNFQPGDKRKARDISIISSPVEGN